jgi:hypothetical protein
MVQIMRLRLQGSSPRRRSHCDTLRRVRHSGGGGRFGTGRFSVAGFAGHHPGAAFIEA